MHFGYTVSGENWQFWRETIINDLLPLPPLLLQNAATALMALDLLKNKIFVSTDAIKQGLTKAFLPGRFQILAKRPTIILDVAHNPEGCRKLCEQLKTMPVKGKTHAIVGMLKDKNHLQSLKPLVACVDKWYTATLECERGASSELLAKILSTLNAADISQFQTIARAYKTVLNHATVQDRIVVFGSFYAVSPITSGDEK
jgi:dihydrofolate synthase/folylpolyglutamate synthase